MTRQEQSCRPRIYLKEHGECVRRWNGDSDSWLLFSDLWGILLGRRHPPHSLSPITVVPPQCQLLERIDDPEGPKARREEANVWSAGSWVRRSSDSDNSEGRGCRHCCHYELPQRERAVKLAYRDLSVSFGGGGGLESCYLLSWVILQIS